MGQHNLASDFKNGFDAPEAPLEHLLPGSRGKLQVGLFAGIDPSQALIGTLRSKVDTREHFLFFVVKQITP